MPSIAPLRESYRSLTTRVAETDWTREAGVFLSMQLGAFFAIFFLWVFIDPAGEQLINPTRPDVGSVILLGFPASFFVALGAYLLLRPVTDRITGRWTWVFPASVWLLLSLGPTVVAFIYGFSTMGFEASLTEYFADNGLQFTALCVILSTAFVACVGLPYAITTRRLSLSHSGWRRLAVVVLVVVAIPAVAAAATPVDTGEESDWESEPLNTSEYDDGEEQVFSFYPEEGYITDSEKSYNPDAVLPCETQPEPGEVQPVGGQYAVADTHVGTEWFNVSKAVYYESVAADGVVLPGYYYLQLDDDLAELNRYDSQGVLDVRSNATETYAQYRSTENGRIAMEQVDSMVIYQDVVTENGTVERYAARLCRPDR